jgi:drug/metabolite transporter (DMT)-like permease
MRPPLATILPLAAALGYTFAALMLKRATERGVGPWRVTFLTNWIAALVFAPWWFTGGAEVSWENTAHAVACGGAFFTGQIFTFLALTRGDVSVATPVLGTKVLFVALFGVLLAGEKLTPTLWLAALITAVAAAPRTWHAAWLMASRRRRPLRFRIRCSNAGLARRGSAILRRSCF